MARGSKRADWSWTVKEWRDRVSQVWGACSSLEGALEISYRAFAEGSGFPEEIVTPDKMHIRLAVEPHADGTDETDTSSESLLALWDRWLEEHPERRAAWDIGSRTLRLQMLEQQHVPNPRPFTSEGIIANPDWYRRLYGILGMTDDMFDTFLHIHRFAVAEKEAQRRAKENTGSVPSHRQTLAAIYLKGYVEEPNRTTLPLETKERACRAYCKRMGYKVHGVYRARTPSPEHVPLKREIGIGAEHAFIYYRYDSKHPYHVVHNLLEERAIDVVVRFVESGPSRNAYGDDLRYGPSVDFHEELASLWEIEPPTEEERQQYELLERITESDDEEECAALVEQLRVLGQRMKAQGQSKSGASVSSPSQPNVIAVKPKLCYVCKTRPALEGSAFCSDACAQTAARRYVETTTRGWCSVCGTWIGREGCPHSV